MKTSSDKPRKVYLRKGSMYVCFKGKLFAPSGVTNIKPSDKVIVTANTDEYVGVAGGNPEHAECWSLVEFASQSRTSRAPKAQKFRQTKSKQVQSERQARPRGRTTGKIESDGCEAVAEACKKLGIKWSAEDEKAQRARLRKQGRFGAKKRGMV